MESSQNKLNAKSKKKIVIIAAAVAVMLTIIAVISIVAYSNNNTSKTRKVIAAADKYLSELEYDSAFTEYMRAIEIDPACVEGYLGVANVFSTYIESIDDISQAPDTPSIEMTLDLLRDGYEITQDERIVDAIKFLEEYLDYILNYSPSENEGNAEYEEIIEWTEWDLNCDVDELIEVLIACGDFDGQRWDGVSDFAYLCDKYELEEETMKIHYADYQYSRRLFDRDNGGTKKNDVNPDTDIKNMEYGFRSSSSENGNFSSFIYGGILGEVESFANVNPFTALQWEYANSFGSIRANYYKEMGDLGDGKGPKVILDKYNASSIEEICNMMGIYLDENCSVISYDTVKSRDYGSAQIMFSLDDAGKYGITLRYNTYEPDISHVVVVYDVAGSGRVCDHSSYSHGFYKR